MNHSDNYIDEGFEEEQTEKCSPIKRLFTNLGEK
jgi:hypothetical protein